jgi:hypothetical protein
MTQTAELSVAGAAVNDFLGYSVSISGDTVVVGTQQQGHPPVGPNAAYVFTEPAGGWANTTPTAEVTASNGTIDDGFGNADSISGGTVAIGAPNADASQGAVYLYGLPADASPAPQTAATVPGSSEGSWFTSVSPSPAPQAPATVSGSFVPSFFTSVSPSPAPQTAAVFDGFETGSFSALPWKLSTVGTASNWFVEGSTVHSGSFAAESGAIGPDSNSALSVTLTFSNSGEFSFWRKVTSTIGSGTLIFEIDGVPQLQLSGSMPWQQSFFYVSAGQHTFSWIYAKGAGAAAGSDAACLDDVQFTPGSTLTIEGTPGNDAFSFNASSLMGNVVYNGIPTIVVSLNGETRDFAAGEFTNFVFQGGGGSDTALLIGGSLGTSYATLYANGSAVLTNSAGDYKVSLGGMASVHVIGYAGDVAQFYDSPGNDTFYAYADYAGSGQTLAGMYGNYDGGYSNSASGFGTNISYSNAGGSDTAVFFGSPSGGDSFYAYADYNQGGQSLAGMYGGGDGGYSNSAKGFQTMIGEAMASPLPTSPDTASLFDAPGGNTLYTDAAIASLYGNTGGYVEQAIGFSVVNANDDLGSSDKQYNGPAASAALEYQLNAIGAWGPLWIGPPSLE